MKTLCNGNINNAGRCEKCYQISQTTSGYCTRLIDYLESELSADNPSLPSKEQVIKILEKRFVTNPLSRYEEVALEILSLSPDEGKDTNAGQSDEKHLTNEDITKMAMESEGLKYELGIHYSNDYGDGIKVARDFYEGKTKTKG